MPADGRLWSTFHIKKNGLTVSEFSRSKKAASPLSFFVNLLASRAFAPFC